MAGPAGGVDSQFDPVVVWDLGSGLSTKEFYASKCWAKLVRSADPRLAALDLRGGTRILWNYSRNVDLLWTSRLPLG